LLAGSGVVGGFSIAGFASDTVTMPFENGERPIVKYPQKRLMIGLTSRPPATGNAVRGI
jgi:sulfite dehydrogenase